jgi:hypothetical protein
LLSSKTKSLQAQHFPIMLQAPVLGGGGPGNQFVLPLPAQPQPGGVFVVNVGQGALPAQAQAPGAQASDPNGEHSITHASIFGPNAENTPNAIAIMLGVPVFFSDERIALNKELTEYVMSPQKPDAYMVWLRRMCIGQHLEKMFVRSLMKDCFPPGAIYMHQATQGFQKKVVLLAYAMAHLVVRSRIVPRVSPAR